MEVAKGWKNTYFLSIMMLITSIFFVFILWLLYYTWMQEPIDIIWPIGTSIIIIVLFLNLMKTLKYRLQKRFTAIAPLQISKGVSLSLNDLSYPFSIERNEPIAFNPTVIADYIFIIKNSGIKIGLVPFKKGTWVFIKYDKTTTKNELIKLCMGLDGFIKNG